MPELPGPVLYAAEGEVVQVTLHNNLGEATALYFPGQTMIPDLVGVAPGLSATYTFTAGQAGTYLYEAGLLSNAQHQVALGMYGMLIVTDPAATYTAEPPLVLSEIDPALNNSANPAAFDMRDFAPRYWLINGKAYPDTAPIAAAAGDSLLLRYANAGLYPHSMGLLGLHQTLLAVDGSPLPFARNVVVQNIAPGQTMDMATQLPATAPAGGSNYALYDTNLLLHNNGAAGFGGMMTFITLAGGTPPGTGPTTTSVNLTPSSTTSPSPVDLSATIPGATSAEYFIDTQGGDGSGTAMSDGGSGIWTETISSAGLATGDHTIYVHGTDGTTWGAYNFAVLHLDNDGPMTKALVLSPNPSNGSVPVNLTATGDDSMTGGSNVTAAEYFIDDTSGGNGNGVPMTVNQTAPIASLSATIPAGQSATVYVHSRDAWEHWGPFASIDLIVDTGGPTASGVTVTPDLLYTRVAVRVDATLTDVDTVKKAEGFIDTVGDDGTGFPLTPRDGLFNEPVEEAYATIPLATINALSGGPHTFYVHGQDGAGNWGDASLASAVLTIMPDDIFADGFESSFTPWAANTGSAVVNTAAARTGTNGMAVSLAGTSQVGYVTDDSPTDEPSYHARFYFNPNSTATGNNAQPDIFVGYDAVSTALFRVQYNRTQGGNPTYRVRVVVTHAGGTTTSGWATINNNSWNAIEIAWQSANPATIRLYTGGILRQSLTGLNTSAYRLESVWLGPSGNLGSNVSGTMYFDDFVSKRNTYIGP